MRDDWKDALVEKVAQIIARDDDPMVIEMYRQFSRTALAVALPEILERAAKVADDAHSDPARKRLTHDDYTTGWSDCKLKIAAAIRNLKE